MTPLWILGFDFLCTLAVKPIWPSLPASFHKVVKAKRDERDRNIALFAADPVFSDEETRIVSSTASVIVQTIQAGEWTAVQVVQAFIKSAIRAHSFTNCITEVMFEDALREAKALDEEFERTKQLRGPLHGLPISLKDEIDVKGYDSSIGFTKWAGEPATSDSDLVKTIRAAGGIPLFKTNVAQTVMLSFETDNPLWGRTANPSNRDRSCAGSSGGEAAALTMDGSALGWGSDLGGSLRMPAHYCGIYSLKPGFGRVSTGGRRISTPGFEGIPFVLGPMARSVGDLELACRAVFGAGGTADLAPPLPYRDVKLPEKLKFGYYTTDLLVKASPACKRAVMETVEALRREGHECKEFELPDVVRATEIYLGLTTADGLKTVFSHMGRDPKAPHLYMQALGPSLPGFMQSQLGWSISTVFGDPILGRIVLASGLKTVGQYHKLSAARTEYNIEFYDKVWKQHGFDGIIAPVQATPAVIHNGTTYLAPVAAATNLYNVVDSPVGCIPVTLVDPALDALTEEWTVRGEGKGQGSLLIEQRLYGDGEDAYNAEAMKGLPIGVQVVGKRWEEEKVIAMMKIVDDALGSARGFGPTGWQKRSTT